MTRAENLEALRAAERQGCRLAMRVYGTDRRVAVSGGRLWRRAFYRGYEFGQHLAILRPWTRVGSASLPS